MVVKHRNEALGANYDKKDLHGRKKKRDTPKLMHSPTPVSIRAISGEGNGEAREPHKTGEKRSQKEREERGNESGASKATVTTKSW